MSISQNLPYGQVFALTSWHLVYPPADDGFVICQNSPHGSACVTMLTSSASCSWWWLLYVKMHLMDKCFCCQADVRCVLQLMMTLILTYWVWRETRKILRLDNWEKWSAPRERAVTYTTKTNRSVLMCKKIYKKRWKSF